MGFVRRSRPFDPYVQRLARIVGAVQAEREQVSRVGVARRREADRVDGQHLVEVQHHCRDRSPGHGDPDQDGPVHGAGSRIEAHVEVEVTGVVLLLVGIEHLPARERPGFESAERLQASLAVPLRIRVVVEAGGEGHGQEQQA